MPFMNTKKLFAAFAAVLILFSLLSVFAFAEVPAQMMEAKTFASSSGYSLNYRIYRSPACSTGADPAMLIIYFHGDGGKGSDNAAQLAEKGVLEALVSKSAEETYKDFPYIVVAPQCPEGESFAASEDGTSATHTDVMNAVIELFNELSAPETVLSKCVVMGVGSGTAAALEYALNETEYTSRLVAVGGGLEPLKASQVYDVGVDFLIFAEEGNESMKSLSDKIAIKSDEESPVHFGGSTFDECLDFALGYKKPGIADWVIKDTYISRQFKVSVSCGSGGTIKAVPEVVTYGSSSVVTVTVADGYAIDKVLVDGKDAEKDLFAKSGSNGRVYNCTLKDIKNNRSVKVELKKTESSGGGVSKAPIIFGVVCAFLLVAALVIYKLSSGKR